MINYPTDPAGLQRFGQTYDRQRRAAYFADASQGADPMTQQALFRDKTQGDARAIGDPWSGFFGLESAHADEANAEGRNFAMTASPSGGSMASPAVRGLRSAAGGGAAPDDADVYGRAFEGRSLEGGAQKLRDIGLLPAMEDPDVRREENLARFNTALQRQKTPVQQSMDRENIADQQAVGAGRRYMLPEVATMRNMDAAMKLEQIRRQYIDPATIKANADYYTADQGLRGHEADSDARIFDAATREQGVEGATNQRSLGDLITLYTKGNEIASNPNATPRTPEQTQALKALWNAINARMQGGAPPPPDPNRPRTSADLFTERDPDPTKRPSHVALGRATAF